MFFKINGTWYNQFSRDVDCSMFFFFFQPSWHGTVFDPAGSMAQSPVTLRGEGGQRLPSRLLRWLCGFSRGGSQLWADESVICFMLHHCYSLWYYLLLFFMILLAIIWCILVYLLARVDTLRSELYHHSSLGFSSTWIVGPFRSGMRHQEAMKSYGLPMEVLETQLQEFGRMPRQQLGLNIGAGGLGDWWTTGCVFNWFDHLDGKNGDTVYISMIIYVYI